ncbi:MAG: HAMP domain-containing histidine kinase [Myxococcales bacterium]|nr:HAMP domain-containing histidine kinase [Myxococcales bacterium]
MRRLVGHGPCQVVTVVDRRERNARGERLRERLRALEDASASARAANRARSQLLAYVGEELRGPLAAITSASSSSAPAEIARIRDAGRQLGQLIDRILEITDLDARQLTLTLVPLDLTALVDRVARALEPALARVGVSLVVELRMLEPLVSDDVYLEHVLRDLLVSAAEDNPGGEIVMEVSRDGQPHDATCVFAIAGSRTFVARDSFDSLAPGQALASIPPLVSESLEFAVTRHLCELLGGALEVHAPRSQASARVFIVRLPVQPARAWRRDSMAS